MNENRDRLDRLEREVARLNSQIQQLPVRLAANDGAAENFRLIRGQSYGAQSGTVIYLDNVWVLSGGLDPSGGDAATLVPVYNIFAQSFSDNELIDAVYSENVLTDPYPDTDWETLKTSTGADNYRLLRGTVKGAVTADDDSFTIDNIVTLAAGLDPRSVPGDMAEELTVANIRKENLLDNEPVTCVYHPDVMTDIHWELVVVERYRALRGEYYAGTSTIQLKNVVMLDGGLDPRTDPTDADEIVEVTRIVSTDTFVGGDHVWADWSVKNNRWEARPKAGSGGSSLQWARVYSTIAAATDATTHGVGDVLLQDNSTGALDVSPTEVENWWIGITWVVDAQVCLDVGFDPPRVVTGTCEEVAWE